MFARSALRSFPTAAPWKQAAARRCYATGGSPGSGSKTALISAAVLAAAGGAYYLSSSGKGKAVSAAVAKAEAQAEAKVKEVVAEVTGRGPPVAFTGGDQGFVSLELEAAETVNHNTKLLRFKLPDPESVSGMVAASALLTRFRPEGQTEDGKPRKPVVRPYTAVATGDEATDRGHLDLLVKRYEGGAMSTHLHELQPGERLDVKGPIVKYAWTPNRHEHIALVAGGTGITPMYQLAQAVCSKAAEDHTKVTLVFANVAEEDILLRKELAALENTHPRQFRAFYVLEKPPPGWTDKQSGQVGYISKELLKQVLPEPSSGDIKVFVCGPPGMMKAISGPKKSPSDQGELSGMLKELGYTADQVLKL